MISSCIITHFCYKVFVSIPGIQYFFRLIMRKKGFYRAANAIFGKVGHIASEEVVLQLLISKCIPILLYGLEPCPLGKSDLSSLDFVINRFYENV